MHVYCVGLQDAHNGYNIIGLKGSNNFSQQYIVLPCNEFDTHTELTPQCRGILYN